MEVAAFSYMRADIERAVQQGELSVGVDTFLQEQIAALMMAAVRRLLADGVQASLLERTCEAILRLLGLTAAQAGKEVDRIKGHPLLTPEARDFLVTSGGR